jgi:hypothetical protein
LSKKNIRLDNKGFAEIKEMKKVPNKEGNALVVNGEDKIKSVKK